MQSIAKGGKRSYYYSTQQYNVPLCSANRKDGFDNKRSHRRSFGGQVCHDTMTSCTSRSRAHRSASCVTRPQQTNKKYCCTGSEKINRGCVYPGRSRSAELLVGAKEQAFHVKPADCWILGFWGKRPSSDVSRSIAPHLHQRHRTLVSRFWPRHAQTKTYASLEE